MNYIQSFRKLNPETRVGRTETRCRGLTCTRPTLLLMYSTSYLIFVISKQTFSSYLKKRKTMWKEKRRGADDHNKRMVPMCLRIFVGREKLAMSWQIKTNNDEMCKLTIPCGNQFSLLKQWPFHWPIDQKNRKDSSSSLHSICIYFSF